MKLFFISLIIGFSSFFMINTVLAKKDNNIHEPKKQKVEIKNNNLKISNIKNKEKIKFKINHILSNLNKPDKVKYLKMIRSFSGEDSNEIIELKKLRIPIKKLLKDKNSQIQLEAIIAISIIGENEDIPELEEMGKRFGNQGHPDSKDFKPYGMYTGMAIRQIKSREIIRNKLKGKNQNEKINILINQYRKYDSNKRNIDLPFVNKKIIKNGKSTIPGLIDLLNEAIDYRTKRIKYHAPYNTYIILHWFPKLFIKIGDKRAINVLKRLKEYWLNRRNDPREYSGKIKGIEKNIKYLEDL